MDRGDWQGIVHGVAKSRTRLSDSPFHFLSLSEPGSNPEYLLPNLESFSFYYITRTLFQLGSQAIA